VRVRNIKDLGAGLLFAAFGAVAIAVASRYAFGTAVRMGPGYFPMLLGGFLLAFGAFLLARAFWTEGAPPGKFRVKPVTLVLLSIVLFALMIDTAGLIPAVFLLVFIAASGGHDFRWLEVAILSLSLTAFSWAVFVYGLELPFKAWGL
jgi:hypothetical protein